MGEDFREQHIEWHFLTFSAKPLVEHQRTRMSRLDWKNWLCEYPILHQGVNKKYYSVKYLGMYLDSKLGKEKFELFSGGEFLDKRISGRTLFYRGDSLHYLQPMQGRAQACSTIYMRSLTFLKVAIHIQFSLSVTPEKPEIRIGNVSNVILISDVVKTCPATSQTRHVRLHYRNTPFIVFYSRLTLRTI